MDEVTHFRAFGTGTYGDETTHDITLCGLRWRAIIMNDRPATCSVCRAIHANKGWTFPLPEVVVD